MYTPVEGGRNSSHTGGGSLSHRYDGRRVELPVGSPVPGTRVPLGRSVNSTPRTTTADPRRQVSQVVTRSLRSEAFTGRHQHLKATTSSPQGSGRPTPTQSGRPTRSPLVGVGVRSPGPTKTPTRGHQLLSSRTPTPRPRPVSGGPAVTPGRGRRPKSRTFRRIHDEEAGCSRLCTDKRATGRPYPPGEVRRPIPNGRISNPKSPSAGGRPWGPCTPVLVPTSSHAR